MPTSTPLPRVLLPYVTAILAVGAVLGLKTALTPQVAIEGPFLLFLGAILFTAWSGGVGPGLLATVLAALVIDYFFLPPLYRVLANDLSKDLRLAQFLAEGSFISVLSGLRLRSSRQAHRRAEELSVTLRCIGDAVVTTDANGRVTFLNPRAEELTGWSSGEAAGCPAADVLCLLDEATRKRASGPVVDTLRTSRASALESRRLLVSRAGPERPIDDTAAPIRDRSGQLLGVVMVFRDASERRQVEAARAETLRRTTAILESISDAFYALDRDWRFTYLNAHALAYLGRPADSLLGRTLWEVFPHALGTDTERDFRAAVAAGTPGRFETRSELTGRWVAVVAYPSQEGLAVYFRDITAQKEAEAVLRRSHAALECRVEEQGAELARTTDSLEAEAALRRNAEHARRQLVARLTTISEDERRRISRELHDETSQLLATLIVGLNAVRDRVAGDGTADRALGALQQQAEQIGRSVHRIAWELRPAALDAVGLEAAVRSWAERWSEWAGVRVEFHSTLGPTRLEPDAETQLYRVITEALANVLKHAGATRVGVLLERRRGVVLTTVEDDGHGFDPDSVASQRDRRGLGLIGMRERVHLLGGTLHIESNPGQGTTILARVPCPLTSEEPP